MSHSATWHTYKGVVHIRMSHGTHMNESWHTYEGVMAQDGAHVNEWCTHEWVTIHI